MRTNIIETVFIKGVSVLSKDGYPVQYCNATQANQKALVLIAMGLEAKIFIFPMGKVRYIKIG